MNSLARATAAGATHQDFLVQTVASSLHLQALEIVTITASVLAAARRRDEGLLRSSRHLLGGANRALLLALKYGEEGGLDPALAGRVKGLCGETLAAKRALAGVIAASGPERPATPLESQAQAWRRLAGEALKTVQALEEATKGTLDAVYREDSHAVRQALQRVVAGEDGAGPSGRLEAPQLRQRRQSPRVAVQRTATLHLAAGDVEVRIEDMSRGGLGMVCERALTVKQEVKITLDNGRKVEGVIAGARNGRYGVALHAPLSDADIFPAER